MNIEENWRNKFNLLTKSIKDLSLTSEMHGIISIGMLSMLDSQLSGQFPQIGLSKLPFLTNQNDFSNKIH